MFQMTCPGRCLPIQEPHLPQARCTQALCCARLMGDGLCPLQSTASTPLSGLHVCFLHSWHNMQHSPNLQCHSVSTSRCKRLDLWFKALYLQQMALSGFILAAATGEPALILAARASASIWICYGAAGRQALSHGSCSEWTTAAAQGCPWEFQKRMLPPTLPGSHWL